MNGQAIKKVSVTINEYLDEYLGFYVDFGFRSKSEFLRFIIRDHLERNIDHGLIEPLTYKIKAMVSELKN